MKPLAVTPPATHAYKWVPIFFISLFITTLLLFALSSCDNSAKQKRQKDLDDLNAYIKNQKDSIDQLADRTWADIENTYNAKKADLERDTADMDQEMRNSYYRTVSEWETYKSDFAKKAEENKDVAAMDAIRKDLTSNDVRPDFTDATVANIVPVYQHFVETVKNNKDNYTKEQWTVVNVSWKALKGRKREIAKDIKASDMAEITKQELQYIGIKAVNRPFADSEEDLK